MNLKNENFKHLDQFFTKNKGICWRTFNLLDEEAMATLSFDRLGKYREKIVYQLKAWQRLLRIIPECDKQADMIKALMKKNMHSAIQIASIPKRRFMKECGSICEDENLLLTTYKNAKAVRTQITVKYMNIKQNSESHINATRFHNA